MSRFIFFALIPCLCMEVTAAQSPTPVTLSAGGRTVDLSVGDGVLALARNVNGGCAVGVLEQQTAYPSPVWQQVAQLDLQGFCGNVLAVAAGQTRIVVGSPEANNFDGMALLYVKTASGPWVPDTQITAPVPQGQYWGSACAVDGDRVAVSTRPLVSATWGTAVYNRAGSNWVPDAGPIRAGRLCLDGDTLVVGNPYWQGTGQAWVYERQSGAWVETATLLSSELVAGDQFGDSVSISGDIAVVGAPLSDIAINDGGAAYVFRRVSGSWFFEARLQPSDIAANVKFGRDVDISGTSVFVGTGNTGAFATGSGVYYFLESGVFPFVSWGQANKLTTPIASTVGPVNTYDGTSMVSASFVGPHAIAYQLPNDPSYYCSAKLSSEACLPNISVGGSFEFSGSDNLTITASSVTASVPGMLIWGQAPASIPFNGGTLCVGVPIIRTYPQYASGPIGVPCAGGFSYQLSHAQMLAAGVGPGDGVFAQYYLRDNGYAPPGNIGLSNAVHVIMRP